MVEMGFTRGKHGIQLMESIFQTRLLKQCHICFKSGLLSYPFTIMVPSTTSLTMEIFDAP